jgi:uncharacterized integral membrane protein
MKAALKALILVPLAVLVVLFSLANRDAVTVNFDPFGTKSEDLSLTAPLFLIVILSIMLGVMLGGIAAWLVQGKHRRAARLARAEADRLRAVAGPTR